MSITSVSTPTAVGYMQKESVELFVYLTGGSDKTRIQINNTPHLLVCICKYMTEQAMSAIAILDSLKFTRFPNKDKI